MTNKLNIVLILIAAAFCSCSTQKNTGATRWYHQTKTKYNIAFNGRNAFDEGLKPSRHQHKPKQPLSLQTRSRVNRSLTQTA